MLKEKFIENENLLVKNYSVFCVKNKFYDVVVYVGHTGLQVRRYEYGTKKFLKSVSKRYEEYFYDLRRENYGREFKF